MKKAIVSFAIGDYYTKFLEKQITSLKEFAPDVTHIYWKDVYPPGSHSHHESAYGFKVYAIKEALKQGFEQIIWIDSAFYAFNKLDYIWNTLSERGVYVLKDALLLAEHTMPKVMNYFGESYDSLIQKKWTTTGGSPYGFDFTKEIARTIFDQFEQAEKNNTFGTAEEVTNSSGAGGFCKGHRMDESVMSFIHGKNNLPLLNVQQNPLYAWDNYFQTQRNG